VSKNSWLRPGRPANPESENVAIRISVGDTPWSGDPDGVPVPQTSCTVPNVALFVEGDVDAVVDEDASAPLPPERPHAAATTARHATIAITR
jgi:hypothetical protein